MYLKLNNSGVETYPYSYGQLKADNPQTSFPSSMTNDGLASWGVYAVQPTAQPEADYTKNVSEETPVLISGAWTQVWEVSDASADEIAEREASKVAKAEQNRAEAYRNESDPLFFKSQRGEATHDDWLNKVNEIKARYPK